MKDKLLQMFSEFLEKAVGELSSDKVVNENTDIVEGVEIKKSVDDVERRALFVVLAPQDENLETEDAHGDWYSEKDVEQAMRSFNLHCMKAGLMHRIELESDLAVIEQSYCTPATFTLDTPNGQVEIRKGTWLHSWHFPQPHNEEDDLIWPKVIDGTYNGVSIQCTANGVDL
jgi:hypothetical protein